MLADLAVSVVLCFEQSLDDDRLAAGLARALERVPVFAGRLRTVEGVLEAVCDDTGVPFEVYTAEGTLAGAMGRATAAGSELVAPLDAPAAREGGVPLLTVRVTRTADGGTVLGCSWHHAIGDLHSFMLLLRIWSAAVEGEPLPEAELVDDQDELLTEVLPEEDCGRPGFRVPTAAEAELLAREVAAGPRANRIVQIAFTDAEVARMREEFGAAAGRRLSSGDVLCAHLLSTLRELDGDDAERMLTVPVNARRRLGLSPAGGQPAERGPRAAPARGGPRGAGGRVARGGRGVPDRAPQPPGQPVVPGHPRPLAAARLRAAGLRPGGAPVQLLQLERLRRLRGELPGVASGVLQSGRQLSDPLGELDGRGVPWRGPAGHRGAAGPARRPAARDGGPGGGAPLPAGRGRAARVGGRPAQGALVF
ncbi:acyltransferase [Kitasatospora sp. NPDC096204]|uniref:acyltransferase n=1 Tax=Kitasatospora sp. NPDC096204 TaxID=3364094 RepID=UPI003820F3FF